MKFWIEKWRKDVSVSSQSESSFVTEAVDLSALLTVSSLTRSKESKNLSRGCQRREDWVHTHVKTQRHIQTTIEGRKERKFRICSRIETTKYEVWCRIKGPLASLLWSGIQWNWLCVVSECGRVRWCFQFDAHSRIATNAPFWFQRFLISKFLPSDSLSLHCI